jgi:hypothetical protein
LTSLLILGIAVARFFSCGGFSAYRQANPRL